MTNSVHRSSCHAEIAVNTLHDLARARKSEYGRWLEPVGELTLRGDSGTASMHAYQTYI